MTNDNHITVVRKDDGLWLHFGAYAAVSLEQILRHTKGPITAQNILAFCELACEEKAA